ncbi:MAG: DUF1836 domain-containing protein [Clostridia bacterium]|nr:DUF1836 domain-containing protein [Clostridia bacterium]
MTIRIENRMIPGTRMDKLEMGNVTGKAFLDKIFYIQRGIMLAQIRDISGIDGSTLQNWVKRGWTGNAINKKYSMDQLARILLINMMRDSIQFERIDYVLHYLNGQIDNKDDDIIAESLLYDYVCRIIDAASEEKVLDEEGLRTCITNMTHDYPELYPGARERLNAVLEIIVTAYNASLLMSHANARLDKTLQ